MNVRMAIDTVPVFSLLLGVALFTQGCSDKGTPPPEDPLIASRSSVVVVPGTSVNVTISGGRLPYYISSPPSQLFALAMLVDSSISPATLVITAPTTATIGGSTAVTVADADEKSEGGAPQKTTHGENEVEILINIAAVGNVSYSDDIQPIWDGNCQNRGCHPGGGAPFSLDRFVSWTNLYFTGASNMTCGAIFRVVAGNPDSSLLYLTVTGRTSCPRMPLSLIPGDTLTQVDQDRIKNWIEQGAENN